MTMLCFTAGIWHPLFPQLRDRRVDNRFIVAFELSPEDGYRFTWPYPEMPPAWYHEVLMLVESMPRVIERGRPDIEPRTLDPLEHMKVNGRRPMPTRKKKEFLVLLDEGRIRFSIVVPDGLELATPPGKVKIRLYRVTEERMLH